MLILNVVIACIPAVVAGFFLDDLMDQYLYGARLPSHSSSMVLFFILAEIYRKKTKH